MAMDLLTGDRAEHALIDDLEAIYWVLIYCALHYCKHGSPHFLAGSDLFDQTADDITQDYEVIARGGERKREYLSRNKLGKVSFEFSPLQAFARELNVKWAMHISHKALAERQSAAEEYRRSCAELGNPDWWLECTSPPYRTSGTCGISWPFNSRKVLVSGRRSGSSRRHVSFKHTRRSSARS